MSDLEQMWIGNVLINLSLDCQSVFCLFVRVNQLFEGTEDILAVYEIEKSIAK